MNGKGKAAIDKPAETDRLTALEQRVAALELAARTTEGNNTGTTTPPASAANTYTNGMTQPDSLGRVKLQAVELERAQNGAYYASKNAALPAFAYVRAAETTFTLNRTQSDHVLMNTGENAIMRKGRAVHVVVDGNGKYHEGDTMMDTIACYYSSPDQAAEEILRKYKALASGTASDTNFTPGG